MKKIIVLILMICLCGCYSLKVGQALNVPLHASVGDPLISWEERSYQVLVASNSQFEIIYSGKSGSTLRLLYREYVQSSQGSMLARPAFNQELTYNLDESTEVSFKEVALKILAANSNGIDYQILRGPKEKK